MSPGPFLRRELITSVRRRTAFTDRLGPAILSSALIACGVVAWDWSGWDRASVAGARSFALTMFAAFVATQAAIGMMLIPTMVAPAIASERDRKTLDSLLATRISSAEVVLGAIGAGLLRLANGMAGLLPLVVLMVFLGGVDSRLVLLAFAGLGSTAFALAALAVAVSVGERKASGAVSSAIVLAVTWIWVPAFLVFLLPRIWPGSAPWVAPVALPLLDSSPFGLALNLLGLISRGPLVGSTWKMIGYQTVAASGLIFWAIARLRPASRAVHDAEGRAAILRPLRARWRHRPPCGDDPVLWHEIYPGRPIGEIALIARRLYRLVGLGLFAYVASWFALPAFAELFRRGYGPVPGTPTPSEMNPVARVLIGKLLRLPYGITPGQARFEFNVALRMATGIFDALYVLIVAGAAAECLVEERERDTWLGLIATPLTGREILRAKMLGAIWRTRGLATLMLALWTVGLLAGAVHPLGFLAALAGLVASAWLLAAAGISSSLRSRDRNQATTRVLLPVLLLGCLGIVPFLLPGDAGVLMAAGTIPFQAWASLLSCEDVRAAIHSGDFSSFSAIGLQGGASIRVVLATWMISTAAQAVAAFLLTRSATRDFDAAIGRPTRARGDLAGAETFSSGRPRGI